MTDQAPASGRLRRLSRRLAAAVPSAGDAAFGSLVWALAMTASAALALALGAWETPAAIRGVMLVYGLGGLLAYAPALFLARLLSLGRGMEVRLAAALLALGAVTIAATAAVYVLQYRVYYAQWHAEPLTRIWFLQFAFTALAALYQFLVLGLRLYVPLGMAALVWFAVRFARRPI